MATWKNLDTLASYDKLKNLKNHVNIAEAMSGEKGAERVMNYSTPMAAGLTYNYAAKQVDKTVLDALAELADEAQLIMAARCYIYKTRRLLRSLSLFPPDTDGVATAQAK